MHLFENTPPYRAGRYLNLPKHYMGESILVWWYPSWDHKQYIWMFVSTVETLDMLLFPSVTWEILSKVTLVILIITPTFVLLLCSCVSPSELQFFQFPSLQVLLLDPELIFNKKEVEKIVKCGTWRMSLSTVKVWNFSTSLMFNILALTFFLSSWNCSSWPSLT